MIVLMNGDEVTDHRDTTCNEEEFKLIISTQAE